MSRFAAIGATVCLAWLAPSAHPAVPDPPAAAGDALTPQSAARPRLVIAGLAAGPDVDPRDAWMATAIEETLTWRMRRVPGVIAIPTMRAHQARRELHDDAPPDWSRVVRLLGAQKHVCGTVAGTPSAVTISLTLVDLTATATPPATTAIGPAPLFDALNEATRRLLAFLGIARLDQSLESVLLGPPCSTPSALEYFAKSILAMREDRARDAFYYADRMLEYDPQFRPGQLYFTQLELRLRPGDRAKTAVRLRRLSEAARAANDTLDAAEVEYAHGMLQLMAHSPESAQIRFESAFQAARASQDPYALLGAMNGLADMCVELATSRESPRSAEERKTHDHELLRKAADWQLGCLAVLRAIGDVVAEAPTAVKLAMLYEQLGELDKALAMHQRTLAASQSAGSRRGQSTAWLLIGQTQRRMGRAGEALDSLGRCLELADAAARPTVRLTLADVLQDAKIQQPLEAIRQLEEAWKELEPGDDFVSQLRCLRALAEARYAAGRKPAALEALEHAADIAHAMGVKDAEAIRKQIASWRSTP